MFLSRATYLQRLQCNHQLLLFPSPASALTAEAQKLSREKRELENALSTLKKNSAAAQEELSKASRKLTAEMQSVKRENIRLREVRTYVCFYVHTYMCVEIEDNTVLYIYWCTVHMYFPIHTYTYIRMCKCVQCSQACYSISVWPCVDDSVLSEVSAAAVLRRS